MAKVESGIFQDEKDGKALCGVKRLWRKDSDVQTPPRP
jgi:hypothetical protein